MGTKREKQWATALWIAGGVAFVAVLIAIGMAIGIIDGPWPLIVCGLVGSIAGGVTVRVMNRRAEQRRMHGK